MYSVYKPRYVSVSADISVYRLIIGFADMSKPLSVLVIGIGRYRTPYRQPYRYNSRDQIYEKMLHYFTLFCKMYKSKVQKTKG